MPARRAAMGRKSTLFRVLAKFQRKWCALGQCLARISLIPINERVFPPTPVQPNATPRTAVQPVASGGERVGARAYRRFILAQPVVRPRRGPDTRGDPY